MHSHCSISAVTFVVLLEKCRYWRKTGRRWSVKRQDRHLVFWNVPKYDSLIDLPNTVLDIHISKCHEPAKKKSWKYIYNLDMQCTVDLTSIWRFFIENLRCQNSGKNSWNWRNVCTALQECKQTFTIFVAFHNLQTDLPNSYSELGMIHCIFYLHKYNE